MPPVSYASRRTDTNKARAIGFVFSVRDLLPEMLDEALSNFATHPIVVARRKKIV